jgi:glyoxylase-like metal-dependent hydrolase (beta-lactamase superfamily II)
MRIKKFEFNMFPVNCYVIWDETKEAVVIDPACFYEEEKQLLKTFITKEGLKLTHLLNTHLHIDHILGNPFIYNEFGLKPEAGQ